MADLKDATPRPWRIDAEHLAEGARVSELTKPDSRNGINNLYLDLRDARAELAEATRLLRELNGRTYSHVDGRDLLAELHPRNMLDIRRRQDGQYTWFEGDWLSDIYTAMKPIRAFLSRQEKPNE